MNTPGQNSNAVAELAIAMMIFMARGQFTPSTGSEISGKTLGVQAFGNVGRLVARKAEALGMKVLATDPFLTPGQIREGGAEPVESVEELYARSNFVSVHIPATPQTVGSIGRELIGRMPKNAVLVNTARKEVIDEAGLAEVLEQRPDLKYVTDVAPTATRPCVKVRAAHLRHAQEDGRTDRRSQHQRRACRGASDSRVLQGRRREVPSQQMRQPWSE